MELNTFPFEADGSPFDQRVNEEVRYKFDCEKLGGAPSSVLSVKCYDVTDCPNLAFCEGLTEVTSLWTTSTNEISESDVVLRGFKVADDDKIGKWYRLDVAVVIGQQKPVGMIRVRIVG